MSKKNIFLFAISVFIVFLISIIIFVLTPRGKPLPKLGTDTLYSIVEDGDIILRLGDRFWSGLFKEVSENDKRFSHSGIIRINDGIITVIHSEGDSGHGRDFVNEMPFEDFISVARAIGIYRIKDTIIENNKIDLSLISKTALEYLGVPFDWSFDLNDQSRIYCTELLSIVFYQISPELKFNTVFAKQWDREIIPLDAISASEFLEEIYYLGN